MKYKLAFLLFVLSCVAAKTPQIEKSEPKPTWPTDQVVFEGVFVCLSAEDGIPFIVKSIMDDCLKYNKTADLIPQKVFATECKKEGEMTYSVSYVCVDK